MVVNFEKNQENHLLTFHVKDLKSCPRIAVALYRSQHLLFLFKVRLAALEVLCEMARKLGEDFLPLLPETVPFLAELLEDEEEAVESACQKAVQELEEILGEPLKKYF